jgi:hypothetical protein
MFESSSTCASERGASRSRPQRPTLKVVTFGSSLWTRSKPVRLLSLLVVAVAALTFSPWAVNADAQSDNADTPSDSVWGQAAQPEFSVYDVTGTVLDQRSVEALDTVFTLVRVAITEAGDSGLSGEVVVEIPGGTFADGSRLLVSHQPYLDSGAPVSLSLTSATDLERNALGPDVFSLVGGAEGVHRLDGLQVESADARDDYTFTGERLPSFPLYFGIVSGAPADIETALVEGGYEWDWFTCSAIQMSYLGQYDIEPLNNNDGVNMIGPSAFLGPGDTYLAAAYTKLSPTNEILEWDIVFNTRDYVFQTNAVTPGTYDWQSVSRHEFGHVLGLDHSMSSGPSAIEEVMYAQIPSNVIKFLGEGDRAGATLLYPAHPFTDVPPLSYFERPVAWLTQAGITTGVTPETYGPGKAVTRAQMATFLYRLAGSPVVGGSTPFVDVPATGKFYSTPVLWLLQTGITTGTSPTTFSPDARVTRAQMATFLHRYAGQPAVVGAHPFGDVPGGAFYSAAVNWLFQTGITTGTSPTLFSPDDGITRAQMAAFLHRFVGAPQTC